MKTLSRLASHALIPVLALSAIVSTGHMSAKKSTTRKGDIITTQDGNIQTHTHAKDVISFIAQNLGNDFGLSGVSDTATLKQKLDAGDYISVLKHLWSEKNPQKRLAWLEAHKAGHVVLLFEYARELVNAGKFDDVVMWLTSGRLRMIQDCVCFNDPSVGAGLEMLSTAYGKALGTHTAFRTWAEKNSSGDQMKLQMAKVLEYLDSLTSLPSPQWLHYHSMAAFNPKRKGGPSSMRPQSEWDTIRKGFLAQIKEEAAKLTS